MNTKIGTLIGISAGFFAASAAVVLYHPIFIFYSWLFIMIGYLLGRGLDWLFDLPTLSSIYSPIIILLSILLAIDAPPVIRYVDFHLHTLLIPIHPSMRHVSTKYRYMSIQWGSYISLVYTTDQSGDELYRYYVDELSRQGREPCRGQPQHEMIDKYSFSLRCKASHGSLRVDYHERRGDELNITEKGRYIVLFDYDHGW